MGVAKIDPRLIPVTPMAAPQVMAAPPAPPSGYRHPWRIITEQVCNEYGVQPTDVVVAWGPRKYMPVRIEIVRRLHERGYSLSQIGKWLLRDHTTILWYLGRSSKPNQPKSVRWLSGTSSK